MKISVNSMFQIQCGALFSLFMMVSTQDTTITSSNVDQVLKKEHFSLVLFYAPWQKECKDKIELIKDLQKKYKDHEDVLYFGMADIYNDLKLSAKFRIEDYCVLKYFVRGSNVPERFVSQPHRSRPHFFSFIKKIIIAFAPHGP